jgi:hypothetical protein
MGKRSLVALFAKENRVDGITPGFVFWSSV